MPGEGTCRGDNNTCCATTAAFPDACAGLCREENQHAAPAAPARAAVLAGPVPWHWGQLPRNLAGVSLRPSGDTKPGVAEPSASLLQSQLSLPKREGSELLHTDLCVLGPVLPCLPVRVYWAILGLPWDPVHPLPRDAGSVAVPSRPPGALLLPTSSPRTRPCPLRRPRHAGLGTSW